MSATANILTILLVCGVKLTVQTACPEYHVPDNLKCSSLSLTLTGSRNFTFCSDSSPSVCNPATDGIADGTTAHQWMTTAPNSLGHWVKLLFTTKFRVSKIRLKQLGTSYKQIKDASLTFPGYPAIDIQLSLQFDDSWQSFRFAPRYISEIILTGKSFYSDVDKPYGLQEIEVYDENCGKDELCEHIAVNSADIVDRSKDLVAYPISGKFVKIHLRFPETKPNYEVILNFVEKIPEGVATRSYTATFTFSTFVRVKLTQNTVVSSYSLAYKIIPNTDFTVWIDFSAQKFAFGVGALELSKIDFNTPAISHVSVEPTAGTNVVATICSNRGQCGANALHHWPMDQLSGGGIQDIKGYCHGQVKGGGTFVNTGPAIHSGFTTGAVALDSSKNEYVDLGDIAELLSASVQGWTFSFWLRFDNTLGNLTTKNSGCIISAPGALCVRRSSVKGLDVSVVFQNLLYRVNHTVHLVPHNWYHVTLTWDFDEKLTVSHNLFMKFTSVEEAYSSNLTTDSRLHFGCSSARGESCDSISVADVISKKKLSEQEMMDEFQCSGFQLGQPRSLGVSSGRIPDSGLTASSQQTKAKSARAVSSAGPGGWTPSFMDSDPYLQVDLNQWVVVSEVGVQGNYDENKWVTGYSLSYKQNVAPWTFVDYTTNHSVTAWIFQTCGPRIILESVEAASDGSPTVFEGAVDGSSLVSNLLVTTITTRFLRFHPRSWAGGIAMKVEVFASQNGAAENYQGCFNDPQVMLEEKYDGSKMAPDVCTTICGKASKQYALLKAGSQCFCASDLPSTNANEVIDDSLCSIPCSGKPGLPCGGRSHVAVYQVKGTFSPTWDLTIPATVNIFTNFSLSVSALPENDYFVDFGNGVVLRSHQSQMHFAFTSPGVHVVSAWAMTSEYGEPTKVFTSQEVNVLVPLAVSFQCPTAVETSQIFDCTLEIVQASDSAFHVDFYGGKATITNFVKESLQGVVGYDADTEELSPSQAGVFLFPGARFAAEGKIQGWEVLATKAGVLRLLVVRPVCLFNASESYITSDGSSITAPECKLHECSISEFFCMPSSAPVPSTSTCSGPPTTSLATTHEIVHEYIAYVHVGRNLLSFDSNQLEALPSVKPGYEIAFGCPLGIGAEVAMVNKPNRWYLFGVNSSPVGTILDESSGTQHLNGEFHVKAYFTLSSGQVITESYTNIGMFYPRVQFTLGSSTIEYTQSIVVSESISGGNWTLSTYSYIATNATLTTVVQPLTRGYNVTVTVFYEAGENDSLFQARIDTALTYNHIYTTRGMKPLSLTYSNALSARQFSCNIHVQDIVKGLGLVDLIKPVPTGNASEVEWYLLHGSDVTFKFDLGFGTFYSKGTFDIDGVLIVFASKLYHGPGEYDVSITVYNDVSNLTLMTLAVVEDPIFNMTVEVVHIARDIEVNETIAFNVTMLKGTNPLYFVDFGDGSTTESWSGYIEHSYSSWQVFDVNITVWNNVSKANISLEVTVHKPVEPLLNFTITTLPTNLTDPVAFMLNISSGTDYNCTWNFGDDNTGENDYDDLGTNLYHSYGTVGAYVVFMNCTNRLYSTNVTTLAIVQIPMSLGVFPQPDPVHYDKELFIEWSIEAGTNATYNITFNNIYDASDDFTSPLQNSNLTLTTDRLNGSYTYSSDPKAPGVYEVILTVWNLVTPPQYIRHEVLIDKPVENAMLTSELVYWEVNHTVTVKTTMSMGTNVTLTFDFGDGVILVEFYIGAFPVNGANSTHIYQTDGDFLVRLNVTNSVSSTQLEYALVLQYVPDLALLSNSPQVFPPANINFTLVVNPGKQPPSEANATWNFGDGTIETKPFAFKDFHTYADPGWYIVIVTVFNDISNVNITGYADAQRLIVNPRIWVVNTAGDKGDGASGSGPLGNVYPQDYPIRCMSSIDDGTNVTYTYDFGDGEVESTNLTTLEHQFSDAGSYVINIVVSNSVSKFTIILKIVVEMVVKDITVTNDAPTVLGTPMTFNVEIGHLGNDSCFYFDLQNGSKITFQPESVATCSRSTFSSDIRTFVGNSFTFTHVYQYITEYIVVCDGANDASSVIVKTRAVVVDKPCFYPVAVVIEVGTNVTNTRKFIKSKDAVVPTENVIDCDAAVYTKFKWRVYFYDPDNPHIPEGQNETTYFHEIINNTGIQYDAPRLVVKPRALDYGIYRAAENVSMVGVVGVWDDADGFFEIVKSPLFATILGGSTRAIGSGKNFSLDANSSGDPDVDVGNREGIQVYWLCKRESDNYTFPDDPRNLTVLSTVPLLLQGNGTNVTDHGGLFGNGPGLLNFTGYILNLYSGYMIINETYDFRFLITKDERTQFYDSSVQVAEGDPPEMAIRCERNCLGKFNPSEKITVVAVCSSCTSVTNRLLFYRWSLAIEKDGQWVSVDLASVANSPLDRDTLVVAGGVLTGGEFYRIRVDSWFFGGVPGFSELAKFVNVPPAGGSCQTLPREGYALKNIFQVQCSGWQDTELPLRYSIRYKNGLDGLVSGIYEGMDSVRRNMSMPLGKLADNYTVFVYVSIIDELGAFTTVETRIKVTEEKMEEDAFGSMLADMTSDKGALGNMIAEGNAQALCQFVGAISSLLNNRATPDGVEEATVAPKPTTDGPPKSPKELARLERERLAREEEIRRQEEEAKRKRIEARTKMVSALSSAQMDSVTTVQQTSSALQSLLSTPAEVSPEAQAAASAAMENMADFLLSNAGSTSGSALTSAATGLVSGLGHMISASSGTVASSGNNGTGAANKSATTQQAKAVVAAINAATDKIFGALASTTVVGELPVEIQTPAMSLAAVKKLPSEIAGAGLKIGSGSFALPNTSSGNDSDSSPVDMKGVGAKDNAYGWDESASSVQTQVMALELRNATGHVIPVKNLTEPISIMADTGQTPGTPSRIEMGFGSCMFHSLTVNKNDTSIHFEVTPLSPNAEIIVFLKRGSRPTKSDYDFTQVIPDESQVDAKFPKSRYMFFISNADTNRTTAGTWYLGVCYNGTLEPEYQVIEKENSQETKLYIPKRTNYTLLMYSSGCLFWDDLNDKWSGDGCVVGPQTRMDKVQCLCTHLTSFAGDFFVMPNAIDWSKISLDNLFSNPTVFAVVMSIFGVYIIGMIWCRKKDKIDLQQIGTTPLADNDPRDTYLYEMVFYTGHSAGAGTTANVYTILEGSLEDSAPRAMKDPVRTKFAKSAVDTFLLAVPSTLGRLKQLRVWHDNSGASPSWFLQRVLIIDLQTDKKTWFLCDNFLAVEEDDGLIERTLVPASRDDLTSFNLLFSTEARKSLTDNHLWFSVIKRPPRSTFTRCQRLSCCLSIILTTMLANAMFFQTDSTSSTGTELRVGPISFSVKQISIAITSSMVVLPANILIVSLFRKAGPKKQKKPSDPNAKSDKYSPEKEEENEEKKEKIKEEVAKVEDEAGEEEEDDKKKKKKKKKEKKKKKKSGKLPHWVIYVAYAVVALSSLVSATFTVFYGLTFGVAKSQKWIMTMMISFWQDVLVSQPLKVFAAATFFALVIKNPDKAVEEEDEKKKDGSEIKQDEELVHRKKTDEEELEDIKRLALMPKPPDQVKLEEMRRFKLQQKLMYKIIREILSYLVFVLILLTVAYGNRDYKSHHVNNALTSYFMDGTYAGKMALGDISDINGFYKYLRQCLLPTLKPNFWYGPFDEDVSNVKTDQGDIYALSSPGFNGTKIYHEVHPYPKGYTADRANSWLVGIARIRQLRVIDKGCVFPRGVAHLVGRCSLLYSFDHEDEGHYEEGWVPMNKSKIEEVKNDKWFKSPWSYKTAWQLKGTPYWGYFHTYWAGGYVAELSASYESAVNQSIELEEQKWLDGKTRAVFFEFTVYNPFTNFFAVVNILVEILPTGGYYPYPYIATTRLYRYIGAEAMVIMALEFVFFGYLVYYIVREVKEWRAIGRRAYLRDPWNYFDMLVIIFSIITIVFYFMRLLASKVVIARAKEDPYSFTNFNYVIAIDTMVTSFMSLTVFVSFLKFLRLLRFNRRIGMLSSTLKACINPLASFFLLFMIVFLAYAQFAFLIFGKFMSDYSSFSRCLANMLGMTLGSFDFAALEATNRVIGPIFFFSYILIMVMILMNVFISIINDTFNEVNSDISKQSNDSDIAGFMMNRFVATLKRTGATIQPIYKEPKDKLDQNLQDIEDLSENVQLAMRSLCLESIRHTSWFKTEGLEETDKKRILLELLILTGENFTESEVCDAIPVLDTVLAKYSSNDLRKIFKNFQEKLAREEEEEAAELLKEKMKEEKDGDSEDSEDSEDASDSDGSDDGGKNNIRFDF